MLHVFLRLLIAFLSIVQSQSSLKTNFMFIIFDDLRNDLSIYGKEGMITPNFERLAKKSVVFDYAFCQVAVCSPSRDSLLTGLRPDTRGHYGFQKTFHGHMVFPALLEAAGYRSINHGKIFHMSASWDGGQYEDWYAYQNKEGEHMNATVMADEILPEESFRDYQMTSRAIASLHTLRQEQKQDPASGVFSLGVGFKLPHISYHVPRKYFEMYRGKQEQLGLLSQEELRFPTGAHTAGYRCCGLESFQFMSREQGGEYVKRSSADTDTDTDTETLQLRQKSVTEAIDLRMHLELQWGYAAAVSFVDAQLGRLLDVVDELELWSNLTIVLTSDHGMHLGRSGHYLTNRQVAGAGVCMCLDYRCTRVPLLISHPASRFHGRHFASPVESVDIFPTVLDLLDVTQTWPCQKDLVGSEKLAATCFPLDGKSLAGLVLGNSFSLHDEPNHPHKEVSPAIAYSKNAYQLLQNDTTGTLMITTPAATANTSTKYMATTHQQQPLSFQNEPFALSQMWRCAFKKDLPGGLSGRPQPQPQPLPPSSTTTSTSTSRRSPFFDCNVHDGPFAIAKQVSYMSYSFRFSAFRYTLWVNWDRTNERFQPAMFSLPSSIVAEELYDHTNEQLSSFTHLEIHNVILDTQFIDLAAQLRVWAIQYLEHNVTYDRGYREHQEKQQQKREARRKKRNKKKNKSKKGKNKKHADQA